MKKSTQALNKFLAGPPDTFIHLKRKIFAEYNITYQINNCYSIKSLDEIKTEYQLFFQKYNTKLQERSLFLIDSIFPILLSDIVIQTLIGKVSTFQDFLNLDRFFIAKNSKIHRRYYTYKLRTFIHLLLFCNTTSSKPFISEANTPIFYYQKDDSKAEYYSIYQQRELQELLLKKIKLDVKLSKSILIKKKVILNFRIYVP
jgi:hypothetical protein